jgi:oligopeptide/dipeptide ABC transporter ATP-binding protein
MSDSILEIRDLRVRFYGEDRTSVRAVDGLNYSVKKGECCAIIGESGCGKTVAALSVLRLIPFPPGRIVSGEVVFEGTDLMKLSDAQMREIRGKRIGMIFQEPSAALNPVMTIGAQIEEALLLHTDISKKEAHERAIELLLMMDIPNAEERVNQYPHQFSGGMQQRAMIAMAMCCQPDILIADEPTTALDVTIQAQVLEQLSHLCKKSDVALIIITHNLGVVAHYAESVKIMYGGRIVEDGPTKEVFKNPNHPYTQGLIKAVPRLDRPKGEELYTIEGEPPDMRFVPENSCAFAPRCRFATQICTSRSPLPVQAANTSHFYACHNSDTVKTWSGGDRND